MYHVLRTMTHFFLRKIASKIQVRLILKINIKCPVFGLKFPPVLKMAIYSVPWETCLHLATLDSTGSRSAQMRRIWAVGIHKLAKSPSCSAIPNPEQCRAYVVISVYGASELELKVICVIGNSTIFLLVASFVMEKIKGIHMMRVINWKSVIAYAEEHWNRAAEWHFGPPPTAKTIRDWCASKEKLKKIDFQVFLYSFIN